MKLEIGKKYRTRNNDIVTIVERDNMSMSEYHYGGVFASGRGIDWWKADGSFTDREHHFDIVEEVKEQLLPFDPTRKAEVVTKKGEAVALISNQSDSGGRFPVLDVASTTYRLLTKDQLRLKPLTFVNSKPVLIGDELILFSGSEAIMRTIESYDEEKEVFTTAEGFWFNAKWSFYIHKDLVSIPPTTTFINLSRGNNNTIIAEEWNSKQEADSNKRATHFLQTQYEAN